MSSTQPANAVNTRAYERPESVGKERQQRKKSKESKERKGKENTMKADLDTH